MKTTRPTTRRRQAASEPDDEDGPPPGKYGDALTAVGVRIPQALDWKVRRAAFLAGVDKQDVVTAMLEVFAADPKTWLRLIRDTSEELVSLGDLMKPWTQAAYDAFQEEDTPA